MAYHRQQGVDTAIVRIFNTYGAADAPARRPRDPHLPAPGAPGPADHGVRRRLADALVLLRRRTRSAGLIALAESGYHDPVNIGNPDEFTLLELAKTVIEVTGSSSEIVFEALPTDDPQVRQPDITLAERSSDGSRGSSLREGLRRTIEQSGAEALIGAAR